VVLFLFDINPLLAAMDRAEMSSHIYFKTSLRDPTSMSGPLRAL